MPQADELQKYLKLLDAAFDLDSIIQEKIDLQDIEDYYYQSNWGYLLLHSPQGAVHMALSKTKNYTQSDYLKQVDFVAEEVKSLNANTILEIGIGKGFNLYHLAKRLPQKNFWGLDLSALHVQQSQKKLNTTRNATIIRADFHNIPFRNSSFDYVYEFESVCHALNVKRVLQSIHAILKPKGHFTLFDGFRVIPMTELNKDEKKARHLVEKPMGVQEGTLIQDFLSVAEEVGFELVRCEDMSADILPNLKRIQTLQNLFFPNAFPLKMARIIFPKYLVRNVIAGMLMPYMVEKGIQGYYQITLKRK